MQIRNAQKSDFNAIVQLNESEVDKTSPMDLARLEMLVGLSCYHKVVEVEGQVVGFMFAMDEISLYENANFEFFKPLYKPLYLY